MNAELQDVLRRVEILEAEVARLRNETPDDRAIRENANAQLRVRARTIEVDKNRWKDKLAHIDSRLQQVRWWDDKLVGIEAEVRAELAAFLARDPREQTPSWKREDLEDTLRVIAGELSYHEVGTSLYDRVARLGIQPLPGMRHPLEGRQMRGRLGREIAALEAERVALLKEHGEEAVNK